MKIVQSGKPIWINRTEEELIVPPGQKEMLGNMARKSASLMYIPLVAPEAIIGVISVQSYTLNAYDEDDLALLSGIGYHVAVAVENARLVSALRHELSERKKAEAEVLRAQAERENLIQELELRNTELERFAYTVSHDLKTPLITIGGFLGYLEIDARRGDLDELDSDIQNIKSAVGKMGLLLDELLELSRIGRMMNKPEMIPYLDIVQDALALTHGRLAEKHIQVSVQSAFPSVLVDKARLVEVVQNLVENAAKYMGDQTDPHIWIGVDETSGRQIFTVRDNGVGIASAHHEQIFGLFNKLNPDGEGTGIGLALVKRIVEVHNGRLWVESDGLGQGSTFFFTLNET